MYKLVLLALGVVTAQNGQDLLYAETRSQSSSEETVKSPTEESVAGRINEETSVTLDQESEIL